LSQDAARTDRFALGVIGILAASMPARLWLAARYHGFLSGDDLLAGAELDGVPAAAFYERDLGDEDRELLESTGLRQAFRVEGRPGTVVVFTRSP
jgi:hypothetical protein